MQNSLLVIPNSFRNLNQAHHPSPITHHPSLKKYDAIVLGVAHREFLDLDLNDLKEEQSVVYDVKGILTNCENRL
jgi:UDP-N-acetyl-D-glucosamine/UDP-N-acetyl-D-galactosamine dehydrogenase